MRWSPVHQTANAVGLLKLLTITQWARPSYIISFYAHDSAWNEKYNISVRPEEVKLQCGISVSVSGNCQPSAFLSSEHILLSDPGLMQPSRFPCWHKYWWLLNPVILTDFCNYMHSLLRNRVLPKRSLARLWQACGWKAPWASPPPFISPRDLRSTRHGPISHCTLTSLSLIDGRCLSTKLENYILISKKSSLRRLALIRNNRSFH